MRIRLPKGQVLMPLDKCLLLQGVGATLAELWVHKELIVQDI